MRDTQIWACGGGTQSAAIAALIIQGKLPKPDLAVIVDTERERCAKVADELGIAGKDVAAAIRALGREK